jgi:hypothetical protein
MNSVNPGSNSIRGREVSSRSFLGHELVENQLVVTIETSVEGHTFVNRVENSRSIVEAQPPRIFSPVTDSDRVVENLFTARAQQNAPDQFREFRGAGIAAWIRHRRRHLLVFAALFIGAITVLMLASCGAPTSTPAMASATEIAVPRPTQRPLLSSTVEPSVAVPALSQPDAAGRTSNVFERLMAAESTDPMAEALRAELGWQPGDDIAAREVARVGEIALTSVCVIQADGSPKCASVSTQVSSGEVSIREIVQPAAKAAG